MSIQVTGVDLRVMNMRTRLPFKYGITVLTAVPHVFVAAEVKVGGKSARGIASDHLPPKWFTKDPSSSFADDVADMMEVIRRASRHAIEAGEQGSVFEWWKRTYEAQKQWSGGTKFPPLLWNFGVTLMERAVIDALCRAEGINFSRALREDRLGVELGHFSPELSGNRPADLLGKEPLQSIYARHTVGLIDPLTDGEIAASERVEDGLPQSLEAAIATYGLKHFKIKLGGDVEKDSARLGALARLLDRVAPADYAFTLDGNENYKELEPFKQLWMGLAGNRAIESFLGRLIFVEQPLHRDVALSDQVRRAMLGWEDRPPMIIDESDAELDSARRALDCGYVGTSHKNCKGVFKGIANACLIEHRRRTNPGRTFIMSGEDLSNVGPVALLEDLAVAANLGIESIERNSQHYFRGLSMYPREVQEQAVRAHPDLYRMHEGGFATAIIRDGMMSTRSVVEAPLGVGFELDLGALPRMEQWKFESLGLP